MSSVVLSFDCRREWYKSVAMSSEFPRADASPESARYVNRYGIRSVASLERRQHLHGCHSDPRVTYVPLQGVEKQFKILDCCISDWNGHWCPSVLSSSLIEELNSEAS